MERGVKECVRALGLALTQSNTVLALVAFYLCPQVLDGPILLGLQCTVYDEHTWVSWLA